MWPEGACRANVAVGGAIGRRISNMSCQAVLARPPTSPIDTVKARQKHELLTYMIAFKHSQMECVCKF